ncbi:MAG: diadenylate cyclase CdaA [Elusimicrobia bacterium]|nr:diadenylate cyclase CdaA [Candidatus Liberimonas magnetica]
MELIRFLWLNYVVNIIDILMVAYIFYRLLLIIKGTRAVQIVVGILILAVVTVLAKEVLGLKALGWLLDKFWLGAVVILVVVFQPEIRSALALLGSHRWGRILISKELSFIEEIIEAIKDCSKKQIGALIVLEQDVGLKTYIETGIFINAQVSKELITTIFNPKSAMHDGALVLRNEHLIAARCILPLSHEPIVSILGTRHRAAIGLSEISDSIIIVVSEETGKVSTAYKGRLESDIDPEDLRKRLIALYRKRGESVLFG